ncbi:MAG: AzlC family ABC transporter permease [Tissierellia bacterium]|nr:AzlC family ABC transporter permease [Tissierellia bacterium]
MDKKKFSLKETLVISLPLIIGYFPVAMAFGLLAKNTAISLKDTSLFSILVFAGASQFMALDLIGAGVSNINIIIATFLLNLRHLMMSAALSLDMKEIPKKFLPFIAFGITDESFSVISFNKDKISLPFILLVNGLSYLSWVLGTLVGYGIGEVLPLSLQASMGVGLYAMFSALLTPELTRSREVLKISLLAAAIYAAFYYGGFLSAGWDLVLAILLSSLLGLFIFKEEESHE